MSIRRCDHLRQQLAAIATCGARCELFPACLPPPTPELAARVAAWRSAADQEGAAVAVADALGRLHAAIAEGLDRKDRA
jgi:hypothetical protein